MLYPQENIQELARSYNTLISKHSLYSQLELFIHANKIEGKSKYDLHKLINEIILNSFIGELRIKALLVDYFITQNAVAAFEMKTGNARLDFLRVNGSTISYEIKSKIDSLTKLKRQATTYTNLFEYNNIVIDECHLSNAKIIIPNSFGIIIFKDSQLITLKKAQKNKFIRSDKQIETFNKTELLEFFDNYTVNRKKILSDYSRNQINSRFKKMLLRRYTTKWNFIKEYYERILPLDYQFFFNNNIAPEIIYGD